jgi:transcriptional regulator with XRE-family HTH domain
MLSIEEVRASLANKTVARRKAAGLTQSQLARLAKVRVETISRLENGSHMPSVSAFDKLDRALCQADSKDYTAQLRRKIEVGWKQSQAGLVVDGPAVFAELRKLSKKRRKVVKSV